jgi:hypothetical protein
MKKNIIALQLVFMFFLFVEIYLYNYNKVDLLALTGITKATHPMNEWAINEPFFAYSAKPNKIWNNKSVNNYGFISTPDLNVKKQEGVIRIAFLGGSSTAGTGQNLVDEETWPWKVVEKLRKKDVKLDFINAACGGYTTFESYGVLWSKLRFFKPDIIVVNHGWNDFSFFHEKLSELIYWRKNEQGIYDGINSKGYYEYFKPLSIDKYISWSQILTRLRFFLFQKLGQGEILDEEEYEDRMVEKEVKTCSGCLSFKQNLQLIRSFCIENKIKYFFPDFRTGTPKLKIEYILHI